MENNEQAGVPWAMNQVRLNISAAMDEILKGMSEYRMGGIPTQFSERAIVLLQRALEKVDR